LGAKAKHGWERQNNIRALFLFELLCKAAFTMVFYPVCKAAFKLLLKVTGYSYLTLENLPRFVRHPATVVVLIVILLACSLFYLVESVSLIVFYQGYVREEKIGVIQVLFPGISRAAELLRKKKRGRILLFSLLNALLTLSPMLFVFAVQFKVPAYIARTVASRTYGGIAIFLFLIICLLVNFFGVYSLYYCVLSEDDFSTGFKKSSKVVWKYRYRFIFSLLGQNLLLAVFYAVLYVGVLVLVCYIIYCTKSEQVLMAAMLTAYDEVMIYMGIFITVTAQIVNYAALARMFSKYGVMEVAVSFPPNRIEKIQEQIVYEDAVRQMEYAEAEKRTDEFFAAFAAQWSRVNKQFGFEVQCARLGGVKQRLAYCRGRLLSYLNGETDRLEELEEELLPFDADNPDCLHNNVYRLIVSTSEL